MEFLRDNNRVTVTDTDGITHQMWHKLLMQFNYLGYDFREEDDVKTYFDRHTVLQEDQSIAFLRVIGQAQANDTVDAKLIKKEECQAKEHYGLTNSFHKAGYMLANGDMLDFSEGQWQRTLDHRDIHNVLDSDDDEEASDTMYRFISHGNVRMLPNGFHIIRPPTEQQWNVLRRMIRSANYLYADISNTYGYTVRHFEYDVITPTTFPELKRGITEYFADLTL